MSYSIMACCDGCKRCVHLVMTSAGSAYFGYGTGDPHKDAAEFIDGRHGHAEPQRLPLECGPMRILTEHAAEAQGYAEWYREDDGTWKTGPSE